MRSTVRERAARPHRLRAGDVSDAPSGLARLVLARCQGTMDAAGFAREIERWAATQASVDDVVIRLLAAKRSARREYDLAAETLDNAVDPVLPVAVRAVTEKALRSALTDPVTGLRTRSSLAEEFRAAIEAAAGDDTKLSVVLIDVDGLKRINDTQGHAAGDELLRSLGQAIKATLRARDSGYRFGGDEFLLLLPDVDTEGVTSLHERLQLAGAPSISVGFATYPSEGTTAQELLAVADQRLYDAKQRHRARTIHLTASWQKRVFTGAAAAAVVGVLAAGAALWSGGTSTTSKSPALAARPPAVSAPRHVTAKPVAAKPPAVAPAHVLGVRVQRPVNPSTVVRAARPPAPTSSQPAISFQPAPNTGGLPSVTGASTASASNPIGSVVGSAVGTVGHLLTGVLCLLGCK